MIASTISMAFFIALARTLPLVWMVPVFGGPRLAAPIRIGLGGLVAFLCVPFVIAKPILHAGAAWGSSPALAVLIPIALREILLGSAIGICAGVVFRAAEWAGTAVQPVVGFGAEGEGRLADLYQLLATLMFLEMGGLPRLAQALARSYETVPVGDVVGRLPFKALAELVVLSAARTMESALLLAAPVLVAGWVSTLLFALALRFSPLGGQTTTWMPLRAWLGTGFLLVGVGAFEWGFGARMNDALDLVWSAIRLWAPR